ncbi:DUF4397 domain-containing protein [Pedobacter sp.]|uniref:DUF4397 domain-containing protein n=1 Tax=Pedobacter sp. TaxID=1411316 RepID=UPI003D7F72EC
MIKNYTQLNFNKFSRVLVLSLGLLTVLFYSACKTSDDSVSASTSYITVVNASPTVATYNLYLNNSKMNTAAIPLGGTLAYTQLLEGTYDLKFTTASSTESLLTKSIALTGSTTYSYYLIGRAGNLDLMRVTDNMAAGSDKATIRLANLSPDAPAVDLVVNAVEATTNVVSNQSYKSVSDFVAIEAKKYSFNIKKQGTNEVVATLNDVTLVAGKYYTLLLRGVISPANDTEVPIAATLITNL